MHIWTLASAASSPQSPRSALWNLALGAYVATSQMAPGNVAMAISYNSPSWIWAAGWSLRTVGVGERPNRLRFVSQLRQRLETRHDAWP